MISIPTDSSRGTTASSSFAIKPLLSLPARWPPFENSESHMKSSPAGQTSSNDPCPCQQRHGIFGRTKLETDSERASKSHHNKTKKGYHSIGRPKKRANDEEGIVRGKSSIACVVKTKEGNNRKADMEKVSSSPDKRQRNRRHKKYWTDWIEQEGFGDNGRQAEASRQERNRTRKARDRGAEASKATKTVSPRSPVSIYELDQRNRDPPCPSAEQLGLVRRCCDQRRRKQISHQLSAGVCSIGIADGIVSTYTSFSGAAWKLREIPVKGTSLSG